MNVGCRHNFQGKAYKRWLKQKLSGLQRTELTSFKDYRENINLIHEGPYIPVMSVNRNRTTTKREKYRTAHTVSTDCNLSYTSNKTGYRIKEDFGLQIALQVQDHATVTKIYESASHVSILVKV